ncbi:MAG: flagellar basal body L-ring protein FlgH [Chromatiales bacterium]|jgi:flagellar L-ring protein precursor FlgH|nr:flagellar basal body L-ring protein FlgH [Chromatiales bacterium]
MNIGRLITTAGLAIVLAGLGACTTIGSPPQLDYRPTMPPQPVLPPATSGTIYQPARGLSLFEDVKARRIGDTLTIRLSEKTQASKSASSDASKESSVDTGIPIIGGKEITRNGKNILNNEWETAQDFEGKGSSSQSNSLTGNITVTVADVYPNGNLLVRGEKWLTLNQGEEFVQISGIVRPVDIASDNSVDSYKVADARITYSGRGTLADANRPGLLTRFFIKLWPF